MNLRILSSFLIVIALAIILFKPSQGQYITTKTTPISLHNVKLVGVTPKKQIVKKKPKKVIDHYKNIPLSSNLKRYINSQCKFFGIDESIVYSVFWKESKFNARAINGNYYGLGQLSGNYMYTFAKEVGIRNFNPFNPYHNSKVAIYQLSQHKKAWQSKGFEGNQLTIAMLNSYNMGKGGYSKHLSRGGSLSRDYSRKILMYRKRLRGK